MMRGLILPALSVLLAMFEPSLSLMAQDNDSLLYVATISGDKNKKIDLYTQLSINYIGEDDSKSEEFQKTALNICIQYKLEEKALSVIEKLITAYNNSNRTDLSMKLLGSQEQLIDMLPYHQRVGRLYYKASRVFLDNDNIEMATLYLLKSRISSTIACDTNTMIDEVVNLGYCFSKLGDLDKAVMYFEEAEKLTITRKDNIGLIDIYMNLGMSCMERHALDSALDYHFKALKYCIQTYSKSLTWLLYYNVSCIYFEMQKYDEALAYCKKSIDADVDEESTWPKNEAVLYSVMAEIYEKQGKISQSIEWFQKSVSLFHQQGNAIDEADANCRLGNVYAMAGMMSKAESCFYRAIKLCGTEIPQYISISAARFFNMSGNYKVAYDFMNKAYEKADSTLANERQKAKSNLSQQMKTTEDIMHIERQAIADRQQQQSDSEQQESRRRRLLTILIVVLTLSGFAIVLLLHVRKTNLLLKRANEEIIIQKDRLETANNRAKHRYEFLDNLVSKLPAPFLYFDDNGVVVGCNKEFEEACGFPRKEIIGFNLNDIHSHSGVGWSYDFIKQYDSNTIEKMKMADGKEHDVICHVSTLVDDVEVGYGKLTCVMIIDVTELEDVRRELSDSQKRLEDALSVKTKFFSIFAHDLKNPFNGILGLTNLLAECYENYSSEDIKKYLTVINDSSNNIYHLLTNLLDWAKSQSDMLDVNKSKFLISEPINESIMLNEHLLDQKGITIDTQISDAYSVLADKNMILAVTRNLLGNAIKYTPNGGKITIKVFCNAIDRVEVAISDNGIGMSQDKIDKLFNVDHPISTPGLNNEKGSGLGLIICHQFIRQNEGDIRVESVLGEGTTFTFYLPRV